MDEALHSTALEMSDATRDLVSGEHSWSPRSARPKFAFKVLSGCSASPGAVAGSCGVLAGQPLDTVRIRQQQLGLPASRLLRGILAAEGPLSLFKGMSGPLLTAALQNAVVFHAFGTASRHLSTGLATDTPLGLADVFVAGSFAGAVQTVVVTPVGECSAAPLEGAGAERYAPTQVPPLRLQTSSRSGCSCSARCPARPGTWVRWPLCGAWWRGTAPLGCTEGCG